MDKAVAITRINKIGKIGNIISKIIIVILIIGMTATLLGGVVLLVLPRDTFTITTYGSANLTLSLNGIKFDVDSDDYKILRNSFNNLDFSFGEREYVSRAVSINEEEDMMEWSLDGDTAVISVRRIAGAAWAAFLNIAALFATMIFVQRLCRAFMQCASPFDEKIVKCMRNFAWALIPWAAVTTFTDAFLKTVFTSKPQIVVGVDLGLLVTILLVFALAYIFSYGAVLQTESDETL